MKTERETTRIVRSWLEIGADRLPDRVLDSVLDQLPTHRQRRRPLWWPRRELHMSVYAKVAIAAAAVLVVAVLGYNMLPGNDPGASPSPTATPMPLPDLPEPASLDAGTYRVTPFAGPGAMGVCEGQAGCTESPADDSIAFIVTVPEGWGVSGLGGIWIDSNAPPDGAILIFWRGGWLYEDPCNAIGSPSTEVGPTVDDFATALADHPLIDATTPVDVTLGGFSGRYVDVSAPADIAGCTGEYRIWDPNIYAQGPAHRWHLWILDVSGTRVVVETMDFAGISESRASELQAMVDSIEITP